MIICEPICKSMIHLPFNLKILKTIIFEMPDETIKLVCEKKHWEYLTDKLNQQEIERISYYPITPVNRQTKPIEWLFQLIFLFKLKKISSKDEPWLFLTTTVPILWWLCFIFKSHNASTILHSILSEVDAWVPRNPFLKLLSIRHIFEHFYKFLPNVIVIEDYIEKNLLNLIPKLKNKLTLIPHPLPDDKTDDISPKKADSLSISFIGAFDIKRGSEDFLSISKKNKKQPIKFNVIGKNISQHNTAKLQKVFNKGPFDKQLNREDFIERITECNYIFLGQDFQHYLWTASGVMLDIFHFEKPVISKVLQPSQQKQLKGIGYFFNNEDELNKIIQNIIYPSDEQASTYQGFVNKLKKLKKQRSEEYLIAMQKFCKEITPP